MFGSKYGCFQVEYAAMEYQLPRLIKMWTHLERQAGGKSRGMGEKQIEVDRRLLRSRIAQLRNKLDEVDCVNPVSSRSGQQHRCTNLYSLK
jgi:GTP-binding protein HflX